MKHHRHAGGGLVVLSCVLFRALLLLSPLSPLFLSPLPSPHLASASSASHPPLCMRPLRPPLGPDPSLHCTPRAPPVSPNPHQFPSGRGRPVLAPSSRPTAHAPRLSHRPPSLRSAASINSILVRCSSRRPPSAHLSRRLTPTCPVPRARCGARNNCSTRALLRRAPCSARDVPRRNAPSVAPPSRGTSRRYTSA